MTWNKSAGSTPIARNFCNHLQPFEKKRGTAVNRALIHLPHGVDVTYRNLSKTQVAGEKVLRSLSKMKPAPVKRGQLSFRPWRMSYGGCAP